MTITDIESEFHEIAEDFGICETSINKVLDRMRWETTGILNPASDLLPSWLTRVIDGLEQDVEEYCASPHQPLHRRLVHVMCAYYISGEVWP